MLLKDPNRAKIRLIIVKSKIKKLFDKHYINYIIMNNRMKLGNNVREDDPWIEEIY